MRPTMVMALWYQYDIVANGHKYHMGYTGISGVNPNDFFVKLSLEKAHLELIPSSVIETILLLLRSSL